MLRFEVTAKCCPCLAQHRAYVIPLGLQAVIQLIVFALYVRRGPLGEWLDEIALLQCDMPAKFGRQAKTMVVVVPLGASAVTQRDFRIVVKAVDFYNAVEVIAAGTVQPSAVQPQVIAVDLPTGTTTEVQVRATTPADIANVNGYRVQTLVCQPHHAPSSLETNTNHQEHTS
ncbi:hypothetical protein D9M71_302700 [compost metagenome]